MLNFKSFNPICCIIKGKKKKTKTEASVHRISVKRRKKSCWVKQTLPALPQASHCDARRLNRDKVEEGRAKTGGLSCGGAGANAAVKAFRQGDESRGGGVGVGVGVEGRGGEGRHCMLALLERLVKVQTAREVLMNAGHG